VVDPVLTVPVPVQVPPLFLDLPDPDVGEGRTRGPGRVHGGAGEGVAVTVVGQRAPVVGRPPHAPVAAVAGAVGSGSGKSTQARRRCAASKALMDSCTSAP